mmetsp:Transcript_18159/g.42199  ORF Transcript_18159/g.42199 Transcript_18159/m.42199 type:complete len:477 (-) Transcript_18159:108-1538(-)
MSLQSTGGVAVATTADLNACLAEVDKHFSEHKKWTENLINDFVAKQRSMAERVDVAERELQTSLETVNAELKALRSGMVTNAAFRQHVNLTDKRFAQEKEDMESKLDALKIQLEKDIQSGVGNLRLKAETLNANCIALAEKARVIEETTVPAMKQDLEEQKQKRLAETQRLEAESEKVKELCEQKISHTAAALRFYVTATATKLREELAPLTMAKELEEDWKQKESIFSNRFRQNEDIIASLKDDLMKHRNDFDAHVERHAAEIGSHSKSLKVHEITVTNLQNTVASDIGDLRDSIRNERASLQTEIQDARAAAIRVASANETTIQNVASQMNDLRNFRELIVDRLHVPDVIKLVREWQTGEMPQLLSTVKELDEKAARVQKAQGRDHEYIIELQKATAAIRGHFKMFHAIAVGLDDKPSPAMGSFAGDSPPPTTPPIHPPLHSFGATADDTRLPPITTGPLTVPHSARGQRLPPE